jgi:peptidoglycan/LPS O-acetylase OafA/YrhL
MNCAKATPAATLEPKKSQASSRAPFCRRLNAFRALSCISVICTHIVGYYELRMPLRSLDFAGHQGVYFFFSLSGYLLGLSLTKEVHKRLTLEESKKKRYQKVQDGTPQVQIHEANAVESSKVSSGLIASLQRWIQKSVLLSVLTKYLWNRTWRLFPLYFTIWTILRCFAVPDTKIESLDSAVSLKDIFTLRAFPGHFWTMRIEMMFYYYIIPVYTALVYVAFSLLRKGLDAAAKVCFGAIICALLYTAVIHMTLEVDIVRPVRNQFIFINNMPPFCFGIIAALINYALELRINAKKTEKPAEGETDFVTQPQGSKLSRVVQKIKSLLSPYLYRILFIIVFGRILFLNPGVARSFFNPQPQFPGWVRANLNSHWYSLFILLNDTRGGLWKILRPKDESQLTLSHPTWIHKIIYNVGLWSYPIYLIHPLSYFLTSKYFPETADTLEINIFAIISCFIAGGILDFVIDKMLVTKLIFGKLFAVKKEQPK